LKEKKKYLLRKLNKIKYKIYPFNWYQHELVCLFFSTKIFVKQLKKIRGKEIISFYTGENNLKKYIKKKRLETVKKLLQKVFKKKSNKKRKGMKAPIGVIMGNVDSGKTALLDYIRNTKVQNNEAGGITQQIGATNLPINYINSLSNNCSKRMLKNKKFKFPGMLIIDTPGHGSFTSMRARGSSLCDIAILVVNIFDGLLPTTIESVNMLKKNKRPFIIALNQVDLINNKQWKTDLNLTIKETLEKQDVETRQHFYLLLKETRLHFAVKCSLNATLYWKNDDLKNTISIVPTSAKTGDGIADLLCLWIKLCQDVLSKRLLISSELASSILEVKKVQGFGYILDVIISDGRLMKGDLIILCGIQGPIITIIRDLLTPVKLQDLRVKADYKSFQKMKASCGVRISTHDSVEKAIPGSELLLIRNSKDDGEIKFTSIRVQETLATLLDMNKNEKGIYVQASTLGSLEVLIKFLQDEVKIPVSGTSIGTVYKKDVICAIAMSERAPEYAIILAFDVSISKEAQTLAEKNEIKIFRSDIIYDLQNAFMTYIKEVKKKQHEMYAENVVFPVILEILPQFVINRKNPIILGVHVKQGTLHLKTNLVAIQEDVA